MSDFLKNRLLMAVLLSVATLLAMTLTACSALSGGGPTLGVANPGHPRDNSPRIPAVLTPGIKVSSDDRAVLDYSNAADGYICAESKVQGKFKVLVYSPDNYQYQYTITNPNQYITMPLSCGNGVYSVYVYQNIQADIYASMFAAQIDVSLNDPNSPFLCPNQYVEYSADDAVVQLSEQATAPATSEVEAIDAIYMWCVDNLSYDYQKAKTVQPGYLPDNDDTIRTHTGICFDYAVLCASMMRIEGMPCKLEIGYSGSAYHAWVSVYSSENGVIRKIIVFTPGGWTLLDPTYDSASQGTAYLGSLIGIGNDYTPMFHY